MREAKHKRLHTVWFHPYDIMEKQNYRDGNQVSGSRPGGEERKWLQKNIRELLWRWFHDCIHVSKLTGLYAQKGEFCCTQFIYTSANVMHGKTGKKFTQPKLNMQRPHSTTAPLFIHFSLKRYFLK